MSSQPYQINRRRNFRARPRGQAIVEGTLSLVLIAAIITGGTLLVIGCGLAVYYKSKLAYAAEAGAKYAGEEASFLGAKTNIPDTELATDVRNAVNAALIGQGLPAAKNENITTELTTVNGLDGVKVTVQESGLEIISGGLLPTMIGLTETAFYPYQNDKPTALLSFSVGGTSAVPEGQGIFIPMYGGGGIDPNLAARVAVGGGQGPVPSGSFNYWKVASIGELVPAYSTTPPTTDYKDRSKLIEVSRMDRLGTPETFGKSDP